MKRDLLDAKLRAAEIARQNVLYGLRFLCVCKNCESSGPLEREYRGGRLLCKKCNDAIYEEWELARAEERDRQRFEYRQRIG